MQPLCAFPTLRLSVASSAVKCVSIVDIASRLARNGLEAAVCEGFNKSHSVNS